jgi:hypothetical protein
MSKRGLLLLLMAALLWQRCVPGTVSGGGASETVATVTPCEQGVAVSVAADGDFRVNVEVYNCAYTIVDSGYFNRAAEVTDGTPEWRLPVLPDSVFNIFVTDPASGRSAAFRFDNSSGASRVLQAKRLMLPGGVAGTITVFTQTNGDTLPPDNFIVVVPGSRFSTPVAEDGAYSITGIPEGTYFLTAVSSKETYTRGKGDPDTVAVSGDSISIHDLLVIN